MAAALALAVVGWGCGGDDAVRAEQVVKEFQTALADGDGQTACERLSVATREELESNHDGACAAAVRGLDLPAGAEPVAAEAYITSAWVELADRSAVFLDEGPKGWSISAAGCTRTTPERPYDCMLES